MRKLLRRLLATALVAIADSLDWLRAHVVELVELAGIGLIVYGAHQVYAPAAPITGGGLLLAIAWHSSRSPRREDEE